MTSSGPYVLRPWVGPVPLSADGSPDPGIKINCVEYYDGNLYVGTSASELLHFVRLPPDPADPHSSLRPVFIPASRLTPTFNEHATSRPGVQQILLLPRVGKACILCNRTVTFYSLPELTPSGTREVNNCNWIGGVDLNEWEGGGGGGSSSSSSSVVILLSTNRRIQVVKMEDGVRAIKNIDFAGSILSVRRDSIACVADAKTYALIDVDHQLKIPLMSISSLDDGPAAAEVPEVSRARSNTEGSQSQSRPPPSDSQSHKKSRSTGSSETATPPPPPPQDPQTQAGAQTGDVAQLSSPSPPSHPSTPQPGESEGDKPLPPPPSSRPAFLKPHITSPTEEEFLVVIGTSPTEPGVGMFINLDGDPTRPTITFSRYPKEIVVDGSSRLSWQTQQEQEEEEEEEGYVLASLEKEKEKESGGGETEYGIEIQRWDAGSEVHPEVHWLKADEATDAYGIRSLTSSQETYFDEVVEQLGMSKFAPFLQKQEEDQDQSGEPLPGDENWEAARTKEGEEFARRLARAQTRLAVWSGNQIWWAVRNPLVVQLDTKLEAAEDKREIQAVLSSIEGREPRTEMEFTTMGYIQQKGGVLLLINLLLSPPAEGPHSDTHSDAHSDSDAELAGLERVLVDSKLDPRVVLSLIPGVRDEIIEGRQGIWVYSGVRKAPEKFLQSEAFRSKLAEGIGGLQPSILHLLRRYLHSWRKLKGFGSVSLEAEVFRTVDAALLLVLLELDSKSFQGSGSDKGSDKGRGRGRGRGKAGTPRAELNELVDGGIECFERAITLLQTYRRLFVLSRLYQSRKMAAEVLATWRRIVEGEHDAGQELLDAGEGEQRVRDYLAKIGSRPLVQEYGVWLANRNPRLGVQVFAEDRGKVRFGRDQAMDLLRREAPNAVRFYLEHLVFGKGDSDSDGQGQGQGQGQHEHVDELITLYLDVVLADIATEEGRDRVLAAYEAYRALQVPKPTYRHFLAENASDGDEAWQTRLRLLQLLGGPYTYDEAAVRERLGTLAQDLLVPEAIILSGREGKHEDALRLLVHRLGDFDAAVAYCLRGTIYAGPVRGPAGGTGDGKKIGDDEQQRRLFRAVLGEFLALDDVSDRVQQTGALLDRFGRFFDVDAVLECVPDDWSVDILSGFLVASLRRLVSSRHEGLLASALCSASNRRLAITNR